MSSSIFKRTVKNFKNTIKIASPNRLIKFYCFMLFFVFAFFFFLFFILYHLVILFQLLFIFLVFISELKVVLKELESKEISTFLKEVESLQAEIFEIFKNLFKSFPISPSEQKSKMDLLKSEMGYNYLTQKLKKDLSGLCSERIDYLFIVILI